LIERYRVPRPRVALARAVRNHASAAMDVSDGLMGDLAKLCGASNVSAVVEAAALPLSAPAGTWLASDPSLVTRLVSGGDDYEILCTVPENRLVAFEAAARSAGVPVSVIGRIVAGKAAPRLVDAGNREIPLDRQSYSHF
jgi:thiamine-monophosphate kinase